MSSAQKDQNDQYISQITKYETDIIIVISINHEAFTCTRRETDTHTKHQIFK